MKTYKVYYLNYNGDAEYRGDTVQAVSEKQAFFYAIQDINKGWVEKVEEIDVVDLF